MEANSIEADYLVVGGGAAAMAFVDTLLTETDATVAMIDRRDRPGGHWNDAYPFVRLHHPSGWYGVASRELGSWTKDQSGANAGLYSLASGAEVLAYFDEVMQQRFLPSGRVQWFPRSEYCGRRDGSHRVRSLTSGEERMAMVRRKVVNATHARTEVASTHPPKYMVAPGVPCMPLHQLPAIPRRYSRYTVVGSGKSGMDACSWLLENGVAPSTIRWIMPRDAWWLDRGNFQPGAENLKGSVASTIAQFESISAATSIADLFARLEERGVLLRIDPSVEPTAYRCAIVSQAELAQLRRIEDIVRLGHVRAIEPKRMRLERGEVETHADTLHVDCSARGLQPPPQMPVFDGDTINVLMVRWCLPMFSAALIAYVESHFSDVTEMNAMCGVVPPPQEPIDWLRMWAVTLSNSAHWKRHPNLTAWMKTCRLGMTAGMMRGMALDDTAKVALLREIAAKAAEAAAKLPELLASVSRHAAGPVPLPSSQTPSAAWSVAPGLQALELRTLAAPGMR